MAEFKHWISYLYAYNGEIKGKNVGFVKIDVREGKCRLYICLKGICGFEKEGLAVNLFVRKNGRPEKLPIGRMKLLDGSGEFTASTNAENLFGTGERLMFSGGVWLCGKERDTIYLSSWEKACLDIRDFLPEKTGLDREKDGLRAKGPAKERTGGRVGGPAEVQTGGRAGEPAEVRTGQEKEQAGQSTEQRAEGQQGEGQQEEPRDEASQAVSEKEAASACEPRGPVSLWENLCRYYPKTAPELAKNGIELLQIRPADIRYLPRGLWHLGSNSFLLHGYYRYKHLVLGRFAENGRYFLGVRGSQEEREKFSAGLFGFHRFLPVGQEGRAGYWYIPVAIEDEEGAAEEETAEHREGAAVSETMGEEQTARVWF